MLIFNNQDHNFLKTPSIFKERLNLSLLEFNQRQGRLIIKLVLLVLSQLKKCLKKNQGWKLRKCKKKTTRILVKKILLLLWMTLWKLRITFTLKWNKTFNKSRLRFLIKIYLIETHLLIQEIFISQKRKLTSKITFL